MKKYKIITLCGSTKFKEDFLRIQKELTLQGNIVLSPCVFTHSDNEDISEETKKMLFDIHKYKINMADEIYVINKNGYIGEYTKFEILYATILNKPIKYMEEITKYKNDVFDKDIKDAMTYWSNSPSNRLQRYHHFKKTIDNFINK